MVGMAGVGGGGQPAIYPHPTGLPVQASAMYIGQSQVHGLHTGPHQQSVYPGVSMNNQIPLHQVLIIIIFYISVSLFLVCLFSYVNVLSCYSQLTIILIRMLGGGVGSDPQFAYSIQT